MGLASCLRALPGEKMASMSTCSGKRAATSLCDGQFDSLVRLCLASTQNLGMSHQGLQGAMLGMILRSLFICA